MAQGLWIFYTVETAVVYSLDQDFRELQAVSIWEEWRDELHDLVLSQQQSKKIGFISQAPSTEGI